MSWLRRVLFLAFVLAPATLEARERAVPEATTSRASLAARYDASLYEGLLRLRSSAGDGHIVGDNTGPAGLAWTKSTNVAIDLLATLVAADRALVSARDAHEHTSKVVDVLATLPTYAGLFPEVLKLDRGVRPEVVGGRVRISTLDSAWLTFALDVVAAHYRGTDDALVRRVRGLVDAQRYDRLVGKDGLLRAGVYVDAQTWAPLEAFSFSYDDRNSEIRPLALALVGLGKVPPSVWERLSYQWERREGVLLGKGWHASAFVELTGQIFFDELRFAPRSLGRSHLAYVEASTRVARRLGHTVFGYAPACHRDRGYAEYGLAEPDVVAPYAAAALATTNDPRALVNLRTILGSLPADGRPLPDGLHPNGGQVYCETARALDQGLLFLALNSETVRALVASTSWYGSAVQRLRAMDEDSPPPASPAPAAAPKKASLDQANRTLKTIVEATHAHEDASGGALSVARRRSDLATTTAVRAWMDLLPDAAVLFRHERGLDAPEVPGATWIEAQGRAVLSWEKVELAIAKGNAKEEARVRVRIGEADAWSLAARAYARLVAVEQRLAGLEALASSLRELRVGLTRGARPRAEDDLAPLEAEAASVAEAITDAEGERSRARAAIHAATGHTVLASDVPASVSTDDVLRMIEASTPGVMAGEDDAMAATVDEQRSLLRASESRAWFVPEARPSAYGTFDGASRILGELTAGWNLRPDQTARHASRGAALEASVWAATEARREREVGSLGADARLRAARTALAEGDARPTAKTSFEATARRWARGEQDGHELAAASRALRVAMARADEAFRAAAEACIDRAASGLPHEVAIADADASALTTKELDAASRASLPRVARARRAFAEAEAAHREADAERWSFRALVEGGALAPLAGAASGPVLGGVAPGSAGTLLPARVTDAAVLARVTFVERGNARDAHAAQAAAAFRDARAELVRKETLAAQARAAIELAAAERALVLGNAEAATATQLHRDLLRDEAMGLVEDDALVAESAARALATRGDEALAEGARDEARLRFNAAFARTPEASVRLADGVEALVVHARDELYPKSGLVGHGAGLALRVLALDVRRAEARLGALRAPAKATTLTLQGTHGVTTASFSLGLALSFDLDPARRETDVLEAAEALGTARGRFEAAHAGLVRERRLAAIDLEATERERAREDENRAHLGRLLALLDEEQRLRADLHDSVKARARGSLVLAQLGAERRFADAELRVARATLAALRVGVAPRVAEEAPPTSPGGLAEAIARLTAADAEVLAAEHAVRTVDREDERLPLLGGLYAAAPFAGASFARTVAAPTPTTESILATVGAGATYRPDQGLAFVATAPQRHTVQAARAAARQRAELSALAELRSLLGAEERVTLARRHEQDARHRLDAVARPRYFAGLLGPGRWAEAEAAAAAATNERLRADDALVRKRESLALRGVTMTEALTHELTTLAGDGEALPATLSSLQSGVADGDPETARRRGERDRAEAETLLDALRIAGPITGFVELRAHGARIGGLEGDGRGGSVLASLLLPLSVKPAFDAVEEGARVGLRNAELARRERELVAWLGAKRTELATTLDTWKAATARRRAASLAEDEARRSFRAGERGASVDTLGRAEEGSFEAERSELEARRAFLDASAEVSWLLRRGPRP